MVAILSTTDAINPEYTPSRRLFPFNFRKCGCCMARIVVVKQLPWGPFGGCGAVGGSRYPLAAGDHGPDVSRQPFEVAALVGKRARPVAHGSVTRNHAPCCGPAKSIGNS